MHKNLYQLFTLVIIMSFGIAKDLNAAPLTSSIEVENLPLTLAAPEFASPAYFDKTDIALGIPDNNAESTTEIYNAATPDSTCAGIGSIEREKWINITGTDVSAIPLTTAPNTVTALTSFQAPNNEGTNYGARVRGYVCVPATGSYTFWIASDDKSELWLSTDDNATNKVKIAAVTGNTSPLQWTKYPSQKSAAIQLIAGQRYYIEALHKEASGGDNLAVGWQLPDSTLERPIPGNRLIRFERPNYPPTVAFTAPEEGQIFSAPATIDFTTAVSDPEGEFFRVEFYSGSTFIGQDFDAPFTARWQNVGRGSYTIEARAFDAQGASASDFVNVSVTGCAGTGTIQRELWTNIPGTSLSSVPFDSPPTNYETYSAFETNQYVRNDYGSRMRGWVCVPQSGNYIFWISSDDNSQLWLSTDDTPANKILIASVTGATKFRDYTKYPSQKSVAIQLTAGNLYYIEALHKEGTGNDFISVGWQLPDGSLEQPIPGNRLIPTEVIADNESPVVTIITPANNANFTAPANIMIRTNASDADGTIEKVEFEANSVKIGEDLTAPYEFQWNNVAGGAYQIVARATDNMGATAIYTININVDAGNTCEGSGKIYREIWNGIPGTSVTAVPFDTSPDQVIELTKFETGNYSGNDYGSRIRGYLCVPVNGAFTFFLASDDNSELWLSTDENPENKVMIAYLNSAVPPGDYLRYASQRSVAVHLAGGSRYYIEALHKEGNGADHISVAWRFQNGLTEAPIPGTRLIPYSDPSATAATINTASPYSMEGGENTISIYPNPVMGGEELSISIGETIEGHDVQVEIISGTGNVLPLETVKHTGNGELRIRVNRSVASGIYLVRVFNNKKRWTKKLQIK